jgi:hypothetical protein
VQPGGRLYINLESMWDDFERSVDSLMEMLRTDEQRREETLEIGRSTGTACRW